MTEKPSLHPAPQARYVHTNLIAAEKKVIIMKTIVVYESHWGNTAAIARAIAEGIGPDAQALSTAEATAVALAGADLIVAGAPLLGFSLPTEAMVKSLANSQPGAPAPADIAHPAMRAWLAGLPHTEGAQSGSRGRAAAFETRIWWSPGSAAKAILGQLTQLGYQPIAKPQRFIVQGRYGPLRAGEVERARQWGAALAQAS